MRDDLVLYKHDLNLLLSNVAQAKMNVEDADWSVVQDGNKLKALSIMCWDRIADVLKCTRDTGIEMVIKILDDKYNTDEKKLEEEIK